MAKKKAIGILPSQIWIRRNGYYGLRHCIRQYPELFAHIEQKRERKTADEWVLIAENLEKEHGILPHVAWLQENGYRSLYDSMRSHPELFTHIKQKTYKGNSVVDNIKLAQKLAKNNKNKIPNYQWLRNNDYGGLAASISRNPDRYSHLKQENKRGLSTEENVKMAKELIKKYGYIPNAKWLIKNSHNGLYQCLKKYPEDFKGMKQKQKKGKSSEEWVRAAKELEKKHGRLPSRHELDSSGLSGLRMCIVRNPSLFKGIKQDYKNGVRTIGE